MERIFGRPIVTQEEMRTRIKELGRQISSDYADKDLILVGILKGAYAFYADLARAIRLPLRVDFLVVTSYGSKAKSSGKVKIVTDLGVMTGDDAVGRLTLTKLMPGVSTDQVLENTGFRPHIADHVETVDLPSEAELTLLRDDLDPAGRYFPERKEHDGRVIHK
jgi:hypothetical protein